MTDNRSQTEMIEHARRYDGTGIAVEHHPGYCIAWRKIFQCRTGWLEAYSDHGGDPKKAEAAARFQTARHGSIE